MTPLSRFGRSTKTVRCLLSVCVLSLCVACSKPQLIKQIPPRVDCDAGPAALISPLPDNPAHEAEWIAELIGLYAGEVTKRRAEHDCLDALRAKGVIR